MSLTHIMQLLKICYSSVVIVPEFLLSIFKTTTNPALVVGYMHIDQQRR